LHLVIFVISSKRWISTSVTAIHVALHGVSHPRPSMKQQLGSIHALLAQDGVLLPLMADQVGDIAGRIVNTVGGARSHDRRIDLMSTAQAMYLVPIKAVLSRIEIGRAGQSAGLEFVCAERGLDDESCESEATPEYFWGLCGVHALPAIDRYTAASLAIEGVMSLCRAKWWEVSLDHARPVCKS